jgi:hypothetical protein
MLNQVYKQQRAPNIRVPDLVPTLLTPPVKATQDQLFQSLLLNAFQLKPIHAGLGILTPAAFPDLPAALSRHNPAWPRLDNHGCGLGTGGKLPPSLDAPQTRNASPTAE